MSDLNSLAKDLATSKRQQIGEETQLADRNTQTLEADRARMQTYFDHRGVGPDDVKKWDADAERQKYSTNPLESFGSLASVFGIMASAFTKAPMENALNASAAAMNATRAKDDQAYQRAFEAFKTNMDLAIKRHQMMHEDYQDAVSLMSTDMQIGEAKLKQLAARYGDKQALLMLDHGMSTELYQMLDARSKSMQSMITTNEAITKEKFMDQVYHSDPRSHSKNVDEQYQAFIDSRRMDIKTSVDQQMFDRIWHSREMSETPSEQKMAKFNKEWGEYNQAKYRGTIGERTLAPIIQQIATEHPDWTPAQVILEAEKQMSTAKRPEPRPTVTERREKPIAEDVKREHPDWSEGQVNLEVQRREAAAKHTDARTTVSGETAKLIESKKAELKKDHPDWSESKIGEEAIKFAKQAAASPITGNKREQIESHIQQYGESITTIDKVIARLHKYVFAAGAPGYAGRLEERVSNLLGGSQTDRVQMARDIEYLQLNAPRLLLDVSTGRPLSAEAEHVRSIIAGLNLGDTTANTIRALQEVKQRYERLREGNRERIGEAPAVSSAAPAQDDPPAAQPWLQAPLRKP